MDRPATVSTGTREDWLACAVNTLRPIIAAKGYELPRVRCSIGFPKGHGRMDRVIGQCWSAGVSADGTFEIFVSPTLDDPARILDILVHELGHAILGIAIGHKKPFADYCRAMYLKGPWTATTASGRFEEEIVKPVFCAQRFAFPHRRMNVDSHGKPIPQPLPPGSPVPLPDPGRIGKAGTRLLKCACPACGYTVRLSRKWLDVAAPNCPNAECSRIGQPMTEGV